MVGAFDTGEVGGREVFPSSLRGCTGLNSVSFSSSSVSLSPLSEVSSVIDPSASAPSVEITLSVIFMALVLSVAIILSVRLSGGLSVVLILSVILVVDSKAAVVVWM